jgi:LysR family transcriptional regulator, hydrogen peroxide-inducible genes activator
MHAYLPSLKQLQYFVALHDYKHFGRAAEACFVTQSTLSAGLRELENLLGVVLVERTRRVVRFTAQGEKMVAKAVRVLREAEELAALAVASAQPLTGELRMAVIPTIAPFLLPQMLPLLRAERPELKLYLREENSRAACDSLHRGTVDCVLLALPFACGDVESASLFDDALHMAYPAQDAAHLPDRVAPDAIAADQLLLLEDGHCLKDHALSACNRPDLNAQASMIGTSLHTLVQMVDNGLGITMLPQMAISSGLIENTQISTRPLDADHAMRNIALIWRKNSPREAEFRLLADILQRQYAA